MLIVVTAALFAAIHLPFPILSAGTFLLALFYTWAFLKWRNIWALGLYHGLMGACFFYWVLERDGIQEVLNSI